MAALPSLSSTAGSPGLTSDRLRPGLVGENNLSFIETSALDASNVELAFQYILTGKELLSSRGEYLSSECNAGCVVLRDC